MTRLVWAIIAVLASGCTQTVVKHEYIKNYAIGETQAAYIGEPIIKVRDVYIRTDNAKVSDCYYFKPSNDFTITGEYSLAYSNKPFVIKGLSLTKYLQSDSIVMDGATYSVVNFKDNEGKNSGLLIDSNGNILNKYAYLEDTGRVELKYPALIPNETKIISTNQVGTCIQEKDSNSYTFGTNNFELIYGGINNITISLTYREYTPDSYAKPAFSQNLVYETGAKELRFKTFKIAVIELSNEKIVYKVIEDKLENSIVSSGSRH